MAKRKHLKEPKPRKGLSSLVRPVVPHRNRKREHKKRRPDLEIAT